jgi:hypothetical protein
LFKNFIYFKIAQLIRENRTYLFEYQNRQKDILQQGENVLTESSEDSHQQLMDVHKKQVNRNESFFFIKFFDCFRFFVMQRQLAHLNKKKNIGD